MSAHHHHSIDPESDGLGVAFALNLFFTVVELVGGVLTNSVAIMSDAVHDLGDSIAIGSAWLLQRASAKNPDKQFTYGYQRLSLLAAFINSAVLLAGSLLVLFFAIPRLWWPQMPHAEGMAVMAVFGIVVNGAGALRLRKGKTLNSKVISWHLLEDVLGWVAVLVVSVVLVFFEWPILDPLLSIGFSLFILFNVLKIFRSTLKLFLQAAPEWFNESDIEAEIVALEGVNAVHHTHVWSLDGSQSIFTSHVVLEKGQTRGHLVTLKKLIRRIVGEHDIECVTIEFEFPEERCDGMQH